MSVLAWIGLGNMGGPMSANMVAAGHEVRGFDLNPDAVAAAVKTGVTAARSISDAVADAVFTMLPKGEHARAVYFGDEGVLAAADKATLLVDSSTIDIDTAQALHDAAATAGFRFVDAPVSSGMSGSIRFYTRGKVVTTRWPDPATSEIDLGFPQMPSRLGSPTSREPTWART